ncbi:MAG: L-threonylcarbamoyladenylate synthase [Oscillospiraceae bacterium]|nr:L-threonylcarbamoyladenylate synthase [Oscillospiraceae bacterium]
MKTVIKRADESAIEEAVHLLKSGEIVALPTETVYGLACNTLDSTAITKVFAAKNRPQDNPLIVHVADENMLREFGLCLGGLFETFVPNFWPGPLTAICIKTREIIPPEISCGLKTVAVRVPDSPIMLEIIKRCGFPLAAPSANLSGSPSPTTAQHVFDDLQGRIPLILDGGACSVGLESTVIDCETVLHGPEVILILRPGAVTPEMLSKFAAVEVDNIVLEKAAGIESARSPGTIHKHYSPKAEVVAVIAESRDTFWDYVNRSFGIYGNDTYSIIENPEMQTLFAKFRECDRVGVKRIFVRLPQPEGVGLALYNRIIRAAEFNIVKALDRK